MAITQPPTDKKYYTLTEANKTLPLVKAIVSDISALAHSMRERHEKLENTTGSERDEIENTLESDQDRLQELIDELSELGIELKDFFTGLIDFPCWNNGREVYLCWKLGEPTIGHWHEIWAGFAGRKKLKNEG
ncbi:MAG: DUF2203 domain-containing protein [Planctomycetes bacterium]|nr:DUF2203 domain-containing protein [Planctomycetota bacterium]